MRSIVWLLAGGMLLAGCAAPQSKPVETHVTSWPIPFTEPPPPTPTPVPAPVVKPSPVAKTPPAKIIMTREPMLIGKVTMVKDSARFAVLNFPVGSLPGIGSRLSVYRNGLKVGELKVTGPQMDENTVADIVNGEVQIGDEIRGH